jgi:hypothetical protein
VRLLAYVDQAHGKLSGPATRRILQREYNEYHIEAYQRLAAISSPQIYRFRKTAEYRKHHTSYQPTRPTPIPIGERRMPDPNGRPGYLRIDTAGSLPRWAKGRAQTPPLPLDPILAQTQFLERTSMSPFKLILQ